jgi:hypothetical protein
VIEQPAKTPAPPIYLIRHAEKPLGDPPPHGVSIDGEADPESLTPRGWQRAGALVGLFVPRDGQTPPDSLVTPTHLFASLPGTRVGSKRSAETLGPIAARLAVTIDSHIRKDDLGGLVDALRGIAAGSILVAWEHHLIPALARLIVGDQTPLPAVWPDDRFDLVWVFEPRPGMQGYRFRQVPQLLLSGDRRDPIPRRGTADANRTTGAL